MVLESDINCLSKAIHVVNFDFKNEYTVGRRVTNDITVSDISVSRAQSSIVLKNGKVYVQDMDSKFGTFVKIHGMYEIGKCNGNDIIPIQIEKKCFFIRPVNRYSWWWRSFCLCLLPKMEMMPRNRSGSSMSGDFIYDHYQDVASKYPEEVMRKLLPHQYNSKKKQASKKKIKAEQ